MLKLSRTRNGSQMLILSHFLEKEDSLKGNRKKRKKRKEKKEIRTPGKTTFLD